MQVKDEPPVADVHDDDVWEWRARPSPDQKVGGEVVEPRIELETSRVRISKNNE